MRLPIIMFATLAAPLALGACSTIQDINPFDAQEAQAAPQQVGAAGAGGTFSQSLAQNYDKLARFERQEYDWSDQRRFDRKSQQAALGTPPLPDSPAERDIPGNVANAMDRARSQMMTTIQQGGAQQTPQLAARAQVSYDCWLEQVEEGFQVKDIRACRDNFQQSMGAMRQQLQMAQAPQPQAQPMTGAGVPEDYLVFFDFDEATLGANARDVIARAAQQARQGQAGRIVITGHADRVGPPAYNRQLSQARARAVAQALAQQGIPADAIQLQAEGESEPLIRTGDGVRQPQNRRAAVTFD